LSELITINNVSVRSRTEIIFEHLDFTWSSGQHWTVVGSNGSGKSAFLATLAGKLLAFGGHIERQFAAPYHESESALNPFFSYHNLMQLVDIRHDFRNRSNMRDFYYQQRYNSHDSDNAPTVAEHLSNHHIKPARNTYWDLEKVKTRLGLEHLWNQSLIKLSNGESKRLRLATALVQHPLILLIDNVFTGLDVKTRKYFDEVFHEVAQNGTHIMVVTTPDEIPSVVTDVLVLNECKIHFQGRKKDFNAKKDYPTQSINIDHEALEKLITTKPIQRFDTIIHLKEATVRYGNQIILEKVNWTIKAGEHWALSGPNGSGKSTLLSLLNGDHPQAYACDLTLFDRKRGTGESIWDIKRKIGFMSPELYQYFPTHRTCHEVVISGFYDTLGTHKQGTFEEQELAKQWLDMLDLSGDYQTPLAQLSASKQRLCLLARALVKTPPLLILDEPCQGLDHEHQGKFREVIDTVGKMTEMAIIYVTHYQEQLPKCIDYRLELFT